MKSTLSILATALFCCTAPAADASVVADLSIINRSTGERLPTYRHGGRFYVAGKPGDRYALELRNRTGERLLTVISVDGVNVVSGETASASQRGYVLAPLGSVEIAGWRKSSQEVAAFYFTALPDSYAARTNRPTNVGVIGIAAFREYREPVVSSQESATDGSRLDAVPVAPAANKAEAKRSAGAEERLGTGHGERLHAPARQVEFRKASERPDEIIMVYYDSLENLRAQGIIPRPRQRPTPNPFPTDRFVPDPS